jgi:hypothetical protein
VYPEEDWCTRKRTGVPGSNVGSEEYKPIKSLETIGVLGFWGSMAHNEEMADEQIDTTATFSIDDIR